MTSPRDLVPELLATITNDPSHAEDAIVAIGLLLEKYARGGEPTGSYLTSLVQLLGPELALRSLTPDEADTAVLGLLSLLETTTSAARSDVVWAVSKSLDKRIVPPLAQLVRDNLSRPHEDRMLDGIVSTLGLIGTPEALATIDLVARDGAGDAQETAIARKQLRR